MSSQVNKLCEKLKERPNELAQGGVPAKTSTCGLITVAQNQKGKLHSRPSEDIFTEKDSLVENFDIKGKEETYPLPFVCSFKTARRRGLRARVRGIRGCL